MTQIKTSVSGLIGASGDPALLIARMASKSDEEQVNQAFKLSKTQFLKELKELLALEAPLRRQTVLILTLMSVQLVWTLTTSVPD